MSFFPVVNITGIGILGIFVILTVLSYGYFPSQYIKWRTVRELDVRLQDGQEDKNIYLTFDDGPGVHTPEILKVLKENGVKGAFFIVTDFAEKMPHIVDQIKREGHLVCIHGKSHRSLLFRGLGKTREEIKTAVAAMARFGIQGRYYRPPWGHLNLFVFWYMKKMNLQPVMWHLMAGDWKAEVRIEDIERNLLEKIRPGSIVCLHDGRGEQDAPLRTAEALKRTIPKLQEQGFIFRRLDARYE